MTRVVRLVGIAWLIVAAYYVRWALAIGRMILAGTQFTVDVWTLTTPFVILVLAPVATLLAWRKRDVAGRILLIAIAINWLLWASFSGGILHEFLWVPTLLKVILILSVSTLAVIALEHRAVQRAAA